MKGKIESSSLKKNWHQKHEEALTLEQKISDAIAKGVGSWNFVVFQTIFVIFWISLNITAYLHNWDPFPFVLLNLVFSIQTAYTAPIIMMSQNKQNERDRLQAEEDYQTNLKAKVEIEELQTSIYRIESEKLIEIKRLLEEIKSEIKFK